MASILIVEDEALIALMLESAVHGAGHTAVGPFAAVQPALDSLDTATVDGALLDINLGKGATSFPIAAELVRRRIPFIFLTGYDRRFVEEQFPGVPVCSKPLSEAGLRGAIGVLFPPPSAPCP